MTSNASGRRKYTPIGIRSLFGCAGFSSKPTTRPVGVQLGDAEALRIGDAVEQRARRPTARPRTRAATSASAGPRRMLSPRTTAERVVADEVAGEADRVGDAERAALVAVRQVEPEMRAVGEQLDDVADALAADDDHHLADAHPGQRLDRVVDHRPVVDRQQVLVGDDRQREQPGGGPAGEDDALHRREG